MKENKENKFVLDITKAISNLDNIGLVLTWYTNGKMTFITAVDYNGENYLWTVSEGGGAIGQRETGFFITEKCSPYSSEKDLIFVNNIDWTRTYIE